MTENNNFENETKIKDWAKENPKFRKYLNNVPLLTRLYAKHHKPEKVKDCLPDQEAKLTLLISKAYDPKKLRLCTECYGKAGDKETANCGVSDFEEMLTYGYEAGDETGEIGLSLPPWYDGFKDIEEEEVYVVEGRISSYNDKLQLQATKVEPYESDGNECELALKELLEARPRGVNAKMFEAAVQGFSEEEKQKAVENLGIQSSDGVYFIESE